MDCCIECNILIDAVVSVEIDVGNAGTLAYVSRLHSSNVELSFAVVDTQPITSPTSVCPAVFVVKAEIQDK